MDELTSATNETAEQETKSNDYEDKKIDDSVQPEPPNRYHNFGFISLVLTLFAGIIDLSFFTQKFLFSRSIL